MGISNMVKIRIKKGDEIKVITGKDKGKIGKVLKVLPKLSKVIVEGINIVQRHVKPNKNNANGGIVKKELPIHISNVAYFDTLATKITYKILEDNKKVRVSKRSGEVLQERSK